MADATVIPLGSPDRPRGTGSHDRRSDSADLRRAETRRAESATRVQQSRPSERPAPVTDEAEPLLRDVLGDVLRRTRLDQRRTLAEVADAAQVSTPYLSEIERGRKEASSEVLSAVCRALGLRVIDLISRTQDDLAQRDEVLRQARQLTSLRLSSRFDPRNSPVALAA